MSRIAERAEQTMPTEAGSRPRPEAYGFPEAVADAACQAAKLLQAKAIVAFTQSGFTARLISQDRPSVPIVALTPFPEVQRKLGLYWGVSSRLVRKVETTDEMVEEVRALSEGGEPRTESWPIEGRTKGRFQHHDGVRRHVCGGGEFP